ncbi:MAG: hypothetical protein ACJ8BC_02870 [Gemmatimonadales bacterium]
MLSGNPSLHTIEQLHACFVKHLLPRIERHARIAFRSLKCPGRKADAIADTIGVAWRWYVALTHKGKDASLFVSALASLAARQVRSGRGPCGTESSRDVLSHLAQCRHGFVVSKLPDFSTLNGNPLDEALHENTRSPVPEQAAFRIDFPAWLYSLSERDKRVVEDLMLGERTLDVARKHGLSPARVSQLRREFLEGWKAFCGDEPADEQGSTTLA